MNKLELLYLIGRPFSPLYGGAMKLREKFYRSNLLKTHSLPVPVVSIGNLVLGGTGKTPTVQHVANLLQSKGYSPAIISRGYGGTSKECINVVSDGKQLLLSPVIAGDEPYMLAQALPTIPVITGAKRINPCQHAIEELGANILILDDGFQHMSVARDLNLVLFDATTLAGNSRIFPGGPLREPVSALNRCDGFLITGTKKSNIERAQRFTDLLKTRYIDKPIFFSSHDNIRIIDGNGKEKTDKTSTHFFGFCGIANPIRFIQTLDSMEINIQGTYTFKDHFNYTNQSIDKLEKLAHKNNANALLTSAKDYVKLKQLPSNLPIFILDIGHTPEKSFDDFILTRISHQ